ncbi:hypothetical protein BaRGS_00005532 [Batillaria attramentaria]|uniref:Uncharacterized protein n=1 Tax=Batillaria attramentaria TaxID=370345 RepID=A0ABD0LUU5_9CAEN
MPTSGTIFRQICGVFQAVLIAFLGRRAVLKASMRVNTVHVCSCTLSLLLTAVIATLLWSSGDIERNPGPVLNPDMAETLHQVPESSGQSSETIQGQFDTLMHAISSQGKEISDNLASHGKHISDKMAANHKSICENITHLEKSVKWIGAKVKQNCSDIARLFDGQQDFEARLSSMEAKLETLETHSRRNNLKIFGLPESRAENYHRCAEEVVHFLNYYAHYKQWCTDDLERAHRIGKPGASTRGPRPMIVKFFRWTDKLGLLRNREVRDAMRAHGYRLASDLTKNQATELQNLRQQGKTGFYRNGRLHVEDRGRPGGQAVDRDRRPMGDNYSQHSRHLSRRDRKDDSHQYTVHGYDTYQHTPEYYRQQFAREDDDLRGSYDSNDRRHGAYDHNDRRHGAYDHNDRRHAAYDHNDGLHSAYDHNDRRHAAYDRNNRRHAYDHDDRLHEYDDRHFDYGNWEDWPVLGDNSDPTLKWFGDPAVREDDYDAGSGVSCGSVSPSHQPPPITQAPPTKAPPSTPSSRQPLPQPVNDSACSNAMGDAMSDKQQPATSDQKGDSPATVDSDTTGAATVPGQSHSEDVTCVTGANATGSSSSADMGCGRSVSPQLQPSSDDQLPEALVSTQNQTSSDTGPLGVSPPSAGSDVDTEQHVQTGGPGNDPLAEHSANVDRADTVQSVQQEQQSSAELTAGSRDVTQASYTGRRSRQSTIPTSWSPVTTRQRSVASSKK